MTQRVKLRQIVCSVCGKAAWRKGAFAKYCEPCSEKKSIERSNSARAAYAARNADSIREKNRQRARDTFGIRTESTIEAGRLRSTKTTLVGLPERPDFNWIVRFSVPFTNAASKNYIYGWGHHVFKRQDSKAFEDAVAIAAQNALRGISVATNKVWIGIHVEKPHHKGDAINVVDLVCDGLKRGIGVDDRWFAIDFLDWSINKNGPRILIQIAQEKCDHAQACSSCGHILPLEDFGKKFSALHGVDRTCRECRRDGRAITKEKQLQARTRASRSIT